MSDYTWASVYWMYSLMALFAAGAAFFLWRAIRSGAVSGDEAPKYRMMIDDEGTLTSSGPAQAGWVREDGQPRGVRGGDQRSSPSPSREWLRRIR